VRIDRQHYHEEPAGEFTAQMIPGATGVHTYNRRGKLEVIDSKSRTALSVPVNSAVRP
jgi:hypothetical protein